MTADLIFQAIVLGIVQGLTEFIPVSSSAHLTITPLLFKWQPMSTAFLLFSHVGTLIALVAYFWKDLWKYAKALLSWAKNRREVDKETRDQAYIVGLIVLAAIPAGIAGLLFDKVISGFYDNPENQSTVVLSIAFAMAVLGVLYIFSNKLFDGKKIEIKKLTPAKAVLIGLSQAVAFIRGVSRSGITVLTGQMTGLNRVSAAEFSFLISIPIMLGTSLLAVVKLTAVSQEEVILAIIGMVSAAISGYLAVRFMLKYLRNNSLQVFGWYRIIFAILIILILFY